MAWAISNNTDPEHIEANRETLQELVRVMSQDDKSKDFLKELAHTFTEELARKNLHPAIRKMYHEFLDATLEILTIETDEKTMSEALREAS